MPKIPVDSPATLLEQVERLDDPHHVIVIRFNRVHLFVHVVNGYSQSIRNVWNTQTDLAKLPEIVKELVDKVTYDDKEHTSAQDSSSKRLYRENTGERGKPSKLDPPRNTEEARLPAVLENAKRSRTPKGKALSGKRRKQ